MRTKQVVDRQRSAQAVLASGQTNGALIVAGIEARLTPLLRRGEKLPDFKLFVELLIRGVEQSLDTLVRADDAYQHELTDDEAPRRDREARASELSDQLVELREVLSGLYGSDVLTAAGFSQSTPQEPILLSRFGGQVARALPKVTLPRARVAGAKLDTQAAAKDLSERCGRLDQALAAVARETREAQAAQSVRNEAQASFDEALSGTASLLVGLLRLAGKPDLAERVRLSERRGASEEEPEPTPGPAPTPAPGADK